MVKQVHIEVGDEGVVVSFCVGKFLEAVNENGREGFVLGKGLALVGGGGKRTTIEQHIFPLRDKI